jgi:hypothetical protein
VVAEHVGRVEDDRHLLRGLQVASTSRGSSGTCSSRSGGGGNFTTNPVPGGGVNPPNVSNLREEDRRGTTDAPPQVLAVREGEPLPEGYTLVVRAPATPTGAPRCTDTVDLVTPPESAAPVTGDTESSKRKAAENRNLNRSANKQANVAHAKEVKEALAQGRRPKLIVKEGKTHLKTRWQAAAKEVAYKLLDLRKDSWKAYTDFEKSKVHKELEAKYKFEPALDPATINKYLANHLRSARATWKNHWLTHGDDGRHPNCPEEAWEKLIKWWPTEACQDQAAAMADRRSKVQKASNTGRKPLVDRMEDQVTEAMST